LSRSGKYLFVRERSSTGKLTLAYVPMMEEPRRARAVPESFQNIRGPGLSPDDRSLAYESIESGRTEVWLVDFPGFTNRLMVSRGGAHHRLWHPNGTELFFLSGDSRALMSARLKPGGRGTEEPTKLFDLPESIQGGYDWWPNIYDVAADGERFLMLQKVQEQSTDERAAKPNVRVVQNWFEEFREKK
jgi:Tol biopolymer transport system component